MEIFFHDWLVDSNMEIVEHLVMDDLVAIGDELCVAKHPVVSNEIIGIVSLARVNGDLHIVDDM